MPRGVPLVATAAWYRTLRTCLRSGRSCCSRVLLFVPVQGLTGLAAWSSLPSPAPEEWPRALRPARLVRCCGSAGAIARPDLEGVVLGTNLPRGKVIPYYLLVPGLVLRLFYLGAEVVL